MSIRISPRVSLLAIAFVALLWRITATPALAHHNPNHGGGPGGKE